MRCETCRHWQFPRADFVGTVEPGDLRGTTGAWDAAQEADKTYGSCEKIQMGPAPLENLPLAVCMDGSQYRADLYTRAEFGCVLWAEVER